MKRAQDPPHHAFKWKTVRVCPSQGGTNATTFTGNSKGKIDSLSVYIEFELEYQRTVFKSMKCDDAKVKVAMDALRVAYESSDC